MTPQERTEQLDRILGETIGEASLQWEPKPTGVFDTHGASIVRNKAYERIVSLLLAVERETWEKAAQRMESLKGNEILFNTIWDNLAKEFRRRTQEEA